MLTLKKVKELVKAPVHTKRVPSPKVLLEEGRVFLRKEFEHGSHLTLYHNGYVWFSAGKRNTVFHIHDCRGDYAYGASKGKGEVIKEEYFENCEWHIRALFEGEQRVEESQLKCEGVGQTKVSVSYHAVAEDWGEMGNAEERAFITGDGVGKPLGLLAETGGAKVGVTAGKKDAVTFDEIFKLYYALKAPYRKKAQFLCNEALVLQLMTIKDNNGNGCFME